MTTIERLEVVTPADWVLGPKQGQWTYAEYAAIPDDGHRYEVVEGVLYMAPSPNWRHQGIVGEIFACLRGRIQLAGLGRVCMAPFDVELSPGNIVQPDVLVVLQKHLDRVSQSRLIGAPDLVVEVASPSTVRHDLTEKLNAYARAGVPEYWVVNPDAQTVEVLMLEKGAYSSLGLFYGSSTLPSRVVPDMAVSVRQFFVDE